jgi:hypothetical protein
VADDLEPSSLATCLRRAFALAPADTVRYRETAAALLHDYSAEQAVVTLRERVLPQLLG